MTWDVSDCCEQSWLFWWHLRLGLYIVMDEHAAERCILSPCLFHLEASRHFPGVPVTCFFFPSINAAEGQRKLLPAFFRLRPFVTSVFVAPGGFIWMLLVSSAMIPAFDRYPWIYRYSGPTRGGKQHLYASQQGNSTHAWFAGHLSVCKFKYWNFVFVPFQ